MRWEQVRVFGHAVDELDGPNVVLLRLFLLRRGHHIHPLVAPLSHGETFDELVCIESGDRRYRTFEVIVFGVSRTVGASRLSRQSRVAAGSN